MAPLPVAVAHTRVVEIHGTFRHDILAGFKPEGALVTRSQQVVDLKRDACALREYGVPGDFPLLLGLEMEGEVGVE